MSKQQFIYSAVTDLRPCQQVDDKNDGRKGKNDKYKINKIKGRINAFVI